MATLREDWVDDVGQEVDAAVMNLIGEAVNQSPHVIVEDPSNPGVWSDSVPAGRTWQSRPIEFISDSDPRDGVFGVTGLANIIDGLDRWFDRSPS